MVLEMVLEMVQVKAQIQVHKYTASQEEWVQLD
jgi:hypothetical protein